MFEEAGYIWRYDLASGQAAPIPIEVKEDFASGRVCLRRCLEAHPKRSTSHPMGSAPSWSRAAIFFCADEGRHRP